MPPFLFAWECPFSNGKMIMTKDDLAKEFLKFIKAENVIVDEETQKPYECDGLSAYCEMPMLVVLPVTVEQVQKVVILCHEHEVPVIARGAGTGLCAGAMPHPEGVVLSLAKFNKILDVDTDARTARVQPGVTNLAISQHVSDLGFYYGPDPSSQIACTIGGNVAENSGGVHCLKYGLTVHNILEVKIITVEGDMVTLGNQALDAPGLDLMALYTGSEGLLGITVEVTVKLLPTQENARVVMAGFSSVTQAGDAVGAVIANGIIPAGLEMMDKLAIEASEDFAKAGYPKDAEALLLCEVDGTNEEVDQHVTQVENLFKELGAVSVKVSTSEAERALLWKGRKSAFPAVGRISPDYYCMDGTIPRRYLSDVLTKMAEMSDYYGLRVANVFHAGDGNLHPLILFDSGVPGEFEKTEEFGGKILELCVEVGGCITGEHGVGIEKIRQMPAQYSDFEVVQFHAMKAAFDPLGTLNPGKGIPTLKQCQEYRSLGGRRLYRKRKMNDIIDQLIDQVRSASTEGQALKITGSGSKSGMLSRDVSGQVLDVSAHTGIVEYQPSELVMTARAGTSLREIENTLDEKGQMLSCESPYFGEGATIGGTLACNLSGPSRPWAGSVRDLTLGVRLINGKGEHLRFGGQVMKNVAGYDGSRLQAGALGVLGVITEVSLKVLPKPEKTITLVDDMSEADAIKEMSALAGQPKPITAMAWSDGKLHVRLSGAASAVDGTAKNWWGTKMNDADRYWSDLNEQRLEFFDDERPLWRFSIKPTAENLFENEDTVLDWAGAQRWIRGDFPLSEMEKIAEKAGGHVTLFKGGDRMGEVRQSLDSINQKLQLRLKKSFDPKGIFNPGCLYGWM